MKKIFIPAITVLFVIVAAFYFTKTPPAQAPTEINTVQQNANQTNQVTDTETEPPSATQPITNNSNENKSMDLSQYKTPIQVIDQNKQYIAKMKTTAGDMEIELNAKQTPITVNNFVFLAKKNFYESVIFHRVIKGFMIQGGDPAGTGAGGPGYTIPDEPFTGEYVKGVIAMARTSAPNSAGSQFFIMHDDYPLPPQYVIFGKVTKGLEVVDKIAEAETTLGADGAMSKPVNPVKILSVEIEEK